jgi:hypothetical protein
MAGRPVHALANDRISGKSETIRRIAFPLHRETETETESGIERMN